MRLLILTFLALSGYAPGSGRNQSAAPVRSSVEVEAEYEGRNLGQKFSLARACGADAARLDAAASKVLAASPYGTGALVPYRSAFAAENRRPQASAPTEDSCRAIRRSAEMSDTFLTTRVAERRVPARLTEQQKAGRLAIYRQAVAYGMRDPDSTQFRSLKLLQDSVGKDILCGEINAKNAYGGYVGYDPFYAEMITDDTKTRAVAVPFLASKVGLQYVVEHCQ